MYKEVFSDTQKGRYLVWNIKEKLLNSLQKEIKS